MAHTKTEGGFTLIEVILFLAIAGLMLSGVLVGTSGAINTQRYSEAVYSLQDYLQGQYNLVDNVRNNRPSDRPCATGTGVADSGDQARGTSDCVITGRLISTADGIAITSRPVFATSTSYNENGTELELLDSLGLVIAPADLVTDDDDYELEWDTTLYTDPANKTTANTFSMFILRLPTNGLIRTYTSTSEVLDFSDLSWTSSSSDLSLCLEPDSLVSAGLERGVWVRSGATSSAGIQRTTPAEGAC